MRKHRFIGVVAGFLVVNIAVWILVARHLKQQIFVGMRGPYVSLFNTLSPFSPADVAGRSRFVLTDWVFPKDMPVIGPNGEASMSMTTDGREARVSVRKGTVAYHSPLSFEQMCDLYRKKPFVEEFKNAFEGVATDSNQHAVFVCYGSNFSVFVIVTHIPESPNTSVTLAYRAIDPNGLSSP